MKTRRYDKDNGHYHDNDDDSDKSRTLSIGHHNTHVMMLSPIIIKYFMSSLAEIIKSKENRLYPNPN